MTAESQRPDTQRIATLRKEMRYPAALGGGMKTSVDGGCIAGPRYETQGGTWLRTKKAVRGTMKQTVGQSDDFETRATDLVIRLVFLGLFAYLSLGLLRPFVSIFVWAVILTVALFPVYRSLSATLGGRRGLAATLVTLITLAILLGPLAALTASLVETVVALAADIRAGTLQLPKPPASVATWPMIGDKLNAVWLLASTNLEGAISQFGPKLVPMGETALGRVSATGADVLRFIASVVLMGFLFVPGPRLAEMVRRIAQRIIAPRGVQFVDLAGATIRNVSRGVVGVALLQALLLGVVFQVAGVPGAGLLAVLALMFCLAQLGPIPVVVPVAIWAWVTMAPGSAVMFTLAVGAISALDHSLKPLLMSRGLTTPTLVILLGVLGGTLSHGLLGLFLGPIVLAVFYDLVLSWTGAAETPATSAQGD